MNTPADFITFLKVGKDGNFIKPPGMSDKDFVVHRESALAWQQYWKTGDDSKLVKLGLISPKESG